MIRHCVFIRFKPEVGQETISNLFDEIAALKGRLDGILALHIGHNVSPEAGMDKGYADGFIVDFANAAARNAYLADAEHQKTGAKLVAASVGGVQGIFVYDIETAEPSTGSAHA